MIPFTLKKMLLKQIRKNAGSKEPCTDKGCELESNN